MTKESAPVIEKNITQDYYKKFIPGVHRIGITTQFIAFILMIAPPVYFYFIKGYSDVPMSAYFTSMSVITSMFLTVWITQPATYWPMLGSAGIYMSYFSGNILNMRVPVAVSVQSYLGVKPNEPKGQIATVIGVAVSVVCNSIVLLLVILFGAGLLDMAPAVVRSAFTYCSVAVFGPIIYMRMDQEGSFAIGFKKNLPYIIAGVVCAIAVKFVPQTIKVYGALFAVVLCILVSYPIWKMQTGSEKSE